MSELPIMLRILQNRANRVSHPKRQSAECVKYMHRALRPLFEVFIKQPYICHKLKNISEINLLLLASDNVISIT